MSGDPTTCRRDTGSISLCHSRGRYACETAQAEDRDRTAGRSRSRSVAHGRADACVRYDSRGANAACRLAHKWTHPESNWDCRHARAVSYRWTMSPCLSVDRMGIEPITPILQGSVASLGTCQPVFVRGPSGSRTRSPSLPRTYATGTPTDRYFSDPGWNRTSSFLHVTQTPSPLDRGIIKAAVTGVEPAIPRTGHEASMASRLCHLAYTVALK